MLSKKCVWGFFCVSDDLTEMRLLKRSRGNAAPVSLPQWGLWRLLWNTREINHRSMGTGGACPAPGHPPQGDGGGEEAGRQTCLSLLLSGG